jgi:hypothetical protein
MTTFEQRIQFMREAVQPLIEIAQKIRFAPETEGQLLEAMLLTDEIPPELLDEFRSIADFDPSSLSGEQLAYVTRIAYELKQYGLGRH